MDRKRSISPIVKNGYLKPSKRITPCQFWSKADREEKRKVTTEKHLESSMEAQNRGLAMTGRAGVHDNCNKNCSWDWKKEELGTSDLIIPDDEEMQGDGINTKHQQEEGNDTTQVVDSPTQPNTSSTSSGTSSSVSDEEAPSAQEVGTASRRLGSAPVWMNDYQTGEGLSDEEINFAMFTSLGDPTNFEEAVKEDK
ncbi:hypothetical protein L1987_16314 [Smallanthus sonchifolius]|uniref:Uncharacterized protein n=1 Tax=Smallanthus sonchifolius TaxID=185202 RepID=A0ACB9JA50_9ASTR|nr:hypothetical protein L1987_16314 [Smallanthus sonchifolius]